jgi:hypothetical protein
MDDASCLVAEGKLAANEPMEQALARPISQKKNLADSEAKRS